MGRLLGDFFPECIPKVSASRARAEQILAVSAGDPRHIRPNGGARGIFFERERDAFFASLGNSIVENPETATFATTLSKIVDMVELLGEVDTTGVAPTTTMADRKTVLRPDIAEEGTDRDRLFKNVPEKDNYYIKVPAILDDGGDA